MNKTKLSIYAQRISDFTKQLQKVKRIHGLISIFRLISFIVMILSWLLLFPVHHWPGSLLGITLLIAFFVLIKIHKQLDDRRTFLETLIEINQKELACCQGDFSSFDGGTELIEMNHPYSYDIDLFGPGSFFQYLNRTTTFKGKDRLAQWLSNTPLSSEQILKNQEAIAELTERIDFRQDFIATGKILQSDEHEDQLIHQWLNLPSFFKYSKFVSILLWAIPAINLGLMGLMIFGILSWSFLTIIVVVNLMIVGSRLKQFNQVYQLLSKSHNNLVKTIRIFRLIEPLKLESHLLKNLQSQLYNNQQPVSEQISQLTRLLNALDNRNNLIVGFTLNTFLLWDWQCIWRIERWQRAHQPEYEAWQETLGMFDTLISLATLAYNNPDFIYPKLTEGEFNFEAEQLGHPLLPQEIRVCNNFSIGHQQRFAIVTGANMAGKSTFLRTIAINLVLAGCGAPVCATSMKFTPLRLYSSMRTEDSLMKHESYFFAELKRLQRITQELDQGEKLFIILDEILRGTNSEDKRKGSIGFVKKITGKMAHGLIATHDLELARLAEQQPELFKALCFEVLLKNNELQFDYLLQPGVTQNMNASFLMKQMGIIE